MGDSPLEEDFHVAHKAFSFFRQGEKQIGSQGTRWLYYRVGFHCSRRHFSEQAHSCYRPEDQ